MVRGEGSPLRPEKSSVHALHLHARIHAPKVLVFDNNLLDQIVRETAGHRQSPQRTGAARRSAGTPSVIE